MTKIYNGGGEYTIHLNSGRTIILNEEELEDISGHKISKDDYNYQVNAVSDIANELEDICPSFSEIKEIIEFQDHPEKDLLLEEISNIKGYLDTIKNIVVISSRQSVSA